MPATQIRPVVLAFSIILFGLMASPVAAQTDEAAAWAAVADSQSPGDYRDFLTAFPSGEFASKARQKYSLLTHEKLAPRVQKLELRYPETARMSGDAMRAHRYVILDIVVTADGKAGAIAYKRRSGVDVFDVAARAAASKATYFPAAENGVLVEEHLALTVDFNLQRNPATESVNDCIDFNNRRGLGRP